jgi:hypothetical protein
MVGGLLVGQYYQCPAIENLGAHGGSARLSTSLQADKGLAYGK